MTTLHAPHAALAQLLTEAVSQVGDWQHRAAWLEQHGVVVLDAWIASLTNEQLWEIGHGVQQAGGTMMQWPSVLRETLRRVAEAPSGATGT